MAKLFVKKGATSKLVHIFIQDSSSTTGAGLTGLTSGSTGLICYRARQDDGNAGGTQLTLSAGTRGTWSSGGFVEKDSTNMKGVYELGLDNAGIATGVNDVVYMLSGATNMAPLVLEIQLVDFDPQDAVHLGLSSLPNTAVTTNASLITSGAGTDQLQVNKGMVNTVRVNTAAAGAAGSITLDAGASATNSIYNDQWVWILSGTGASQARLITGYTGSTQVATVAPNWQTNPDNTSVFAILPFGRVDVSEWLGTAVMAATAGIPDVNTKNKNNAAALTDPTNFNLLSINGSGFVTVTSNIKKNAASRLTFTITDSTTHNPKTGVTVAGQVSIDGAAFVNLTNTPATEISNGDYTIALAAADTNGNALLFRFTGTNADDLNIFGFTQP